MHKIFLLFILFVMIQSEVIPAGAFMTTQFSKPNCKGKPIREITYFAEKCWKAENQKYQRRFCDNKTGSIYWVQYESSEGCIGQPRILYKNKNGDCTEFYNEKFHSCNKKE